MPDLPVYLDHHATTPVDPRVVEVMTPYWNAQFGNAASFQHEYGRRAEQAIERARQQIACLIQAAPDNLVFTSGATESNNLAIQGVVQPALRRASLAGRQPHVITTVAEHGSVLEPLKKLERRGLSVTWLPVDSTGMVSSRQVQQALRPETVLVSVIWANNEVGSLNPVEEIARVCQAHQVLFHTDAVQAVGKVEVDLQKTTANLVSFTAHKLYGPQGTGALFVSLPENGFTRLEPLIEGGGQQGGIRSGTLPLALVAGFGAACEIARQEKDVEQARIFRLREQLETRLRVVVPDFRINGPAQNRLAGNLNISLPGVDGEALMTRLTRIAVSSGAACTSSRPGSSHVLRAMGVEEKLCRSSLRLGLGRFNTEQDIVLAASHIGEVVADLKKQC